MSELVAGVLDGLAGLNTSLLYLLAGLFTALETSVGIGLLVPGDGVVLLAGTTAPTPHRFAALVAVTVLGSLAGESVGYLLGRRYGFRLPAGRLGRRLGEDRSVAAEAFLAGRGGRAVAAARFVAVVHALVPVLAGTLGMSYRRLVGWGAVGRGGLVGAVCGDRRGRRRVLAAVRRTVRPGRPGRGCRRPRDRADRASRAVPRPASSRRRAPSSRVQALEPLAVDPLGGGRNERHDSAA